MVANRPARRHMCAMPTKKTKEVSPAREQFLERREAERDDAQQAWREYLAETESVRDRTERLRAARLAREAARKKTPTAKKKAG